MKKIALIFVCFSFFSIQLSVGQANWMKKGNDIYGNSDNNNTGTSVSLSSDGSVLVEGAPGANAGGMMRGHARVYEYSSGSWTQKGSTLSGIEDGGSFGSSVCANSDRSIIAIGQPHYSWSMDINSLGKVIVYQWKNNDWELLGDNYWRFCL